MPPAPPRVATIVTCSSSASFGRTPTPKIRFVSRPGGEDGLSHCVELGQTQLARAADVDEDGSRPTDAVVHAGGGDRRTCGIGRAVVACGSAGAHRRGTTAAKDGAGIGEVEIDAARHGDHINDLGDVAMDGLVDGVERVFDGDIRRRRGADVVVRDRGHRVDQASQRRLGVLRDAPCASPRTRTAS